LLISNEHQAKLGLVKDMRHGICTLKDYPGMHLPLCKAQGSGLLVVNISEFHNILTEKEYPQVLVPHFKNDLWKTAPIHQVDGGCAYTGKTFLGRVKEREVSGIALGFDTYEDRRPDTNQTIRHHLDHKYGGSSSNIDLGCDDDVAAVKKSILFANDPCKDDQIELIDCRALRGPYSKKELKGHVGFAPRHLEHDRE
jgi:hypothetical protein